MNHAGKMKTERSQCTLIITRVSTPVLTAGLSGLRGTRGLVGGMLGVCVFVESNDAPAEAGGMLLIKI